jgi:Holliday junction resolvase
MERKIAKLLGGKRIPLSGSLSFMPGDVITEKFLIECKLRGSSGKKQIAIEKAWLEKIDKEAQTQGRTPLLVFKYKNDKSYYAVMNLNGFLKMQEVRDVADRNYSLR